MGTETPRTESSSPPPLGSLKYILLFREKEQGRTRKKQPLLPPPPRARWGPGLARAAVVVLGLSSRREPRRLSARLVEAETHASRHATCRRSGSARSPTGPRPPPGPSAHFAVTNRRQAWRVPTFGGFEERLWPEKKSLTGPNTTASSPGGFLLQKSRVRAGKQLRRVWKVRVRTLRTRGAGRARDKGKRGRSYGRFFCPRCLRFILKELRT